MLDTPKSDVPWEIGGGFSARGDCVYIVPCCIRIKKGAKANVSTLINKALE